MPIASRPPLHPLLDGLVERLWCATPEPVAEAQVDWILPTCRAQIILSPATSLLVGPKVRGERIDRRTDVRLVGVSLAAGAESAFFGSGGGQTMGATVPLDALLSIGSLWERLADQEGDAVFDCLETELVGWLKPTMQRPKVLAAAAAIRSGLAATTTIELLGVDRRTFVPEFSRMVGAAPKHFERICRFNRTVDALRRPGAAPLADLAAAHGFADQAHLTREFRHFGEISPSLLHRDGTGMINHIDPDKIFKT